MVERPGKRKGKWKRKGKQGTGKVKRIRNERTRKSERDKKTTRIYIEQILSNYLNPKP